MIQAREPVPTNDGIGEGGVPRRPRLTKGLAFKLAAGLVVGIAGFFSLSGYLMLRQQRRQFERIVLASVDRLSDILQSSTRYQMLRNDRDAMYALMRDFGTEPGIRRVRIFNKEGLIRFSTDQAELNRMVDKRAEQCYACHAQEAPLTKLSRPDRARIFQTPEGERVLAVIRPIENQPDCSSAACHAHPPSKRILGVIDAHLSLAGVDVLLADSQWQLVTVTAAALLLSCLFSVFFVFRFVHRPVRELTAGTEKVAAGDLEYRLPVHSSDEIGALAESFNKMTADLSQAHSELTEWARTLEDRVRHKTEELERAHSTLLTSEKMASLGKLAATVAHEVNNPLFGMLTYARLTLKTLLTIDLDPAVKDKMCDHLRVIERESRRCGDIMKNLLAFARQAPPHRAPTNVNTLVERALSLVRHQLELQEISCETELARDLPEVMCDPGQVQQVLLVLLVNASEAMTSGGALSIASEFDRGRNVVRLRVRDSGPGIPDDVLPQIFEPFFTTKENQHRTGLGLAIAKSIVDHHAGSIAVHSDAGKGTEFVIELPLEAGAPAQGSAMAEAVRGKAGMEA